MLAQKRMVMLSPNSLNGRPKALGSLDFSPEGWGIFLGYDDRGNKVLIKEHDLNQVLKNARIDVTVELIVKQKAGVSKLINRLVPGSLNID